MSQSSVCLHFLSPTNFCFSPPSIFLANPECVFLFHPLTLVHRTFLLALMPFLFYLPFYGKVLLIFNLGSYSLDLPRQTLLFFSACPSYILLLQLVSIHADLHGTVLLGAFCLV